MKKLTIWLLLLASMASCTTAPVEIFDLEAFCIYTIETYKRDNKKAALELRLTKKESISLLKSMQLNSELRKQRLAAVEEQDKAGYFSKDRLEQLYIGFRSIEDRDFWRHCTIDGYEYLETETWFGYEMAEPIVILRHGDYTTRFKIGEIIKTHKGWRIIEGPTWK
ncbi:hypothetical protein [Alkaliflexus imshenetskii]|uniref:hypothetical protein n=1 Tax=Alkaliflexus imshenetskii TaxID=286730 RepID=UPI0012F79FB4|nr:hypothetical protein [Alkaliflexus imshenetskii]